MVLGSDGAANALDGTVHSAAVLVMGSGEPPATARGEVLRPQRLAAGARATSRSRERAAAVLM